MRHPMYPGTACRGRRGLLLAGAVFVALALQFADVRLAASQSPTLIASRARAVSPTDPWDPVWQQARFLDLALSAQLVVAPRGGSREQMRARALHDGARLFVLLEWRDATRDVAIDGVTAYSDAAALQFPGASTVEVPPLCMGSPTAIVNIWHWKAAWQEDVARDFTKITTAYPRSAITQYPFGEDPVFAPARDLGNLFARRERTTSMENLHAGQYGTLATARAQPVGGAGVWRDGTWRVLFWRDLEPVQDGDARFAVGDATDAAAALWDGAARERDGMKAVSQFFVLRIGERALPEELPPALAVLVVLGPIALLLLALAWVARRAA